MKQLMWITTKAREHLFSELWESLNIVSYFYDAAQVPNLSLFLYSHPLEHINFFVIDLITLYPLNDLVEAIRVLSARSAAIPIFITSSDNDALELIAGRLASIGMRNIIQARNADMYNCLSHGIGIDARATALQRGLAAQAMIIAQPLHIPQYLSICCAVSGTSPCVGTTTQAILLFRYLSMIGFNPLFIDSTQRFYSFLTRMYPQQPILQQNNYYTLNNLHFAVHHPSSDSTSLSNFNAYIYDEGVLIGHDQLSSFQVCDLRLLISSGRIPHQQQYQRIKHELENRNIRFCSCFTPLQPAIKIENAQLAPWHPDPLAPGDTSHLAQLLLPWLREICHA